MPTNLHIDEKLLIKAQKAGGHKSKRETVNRALEEYLRHREQVRQFRSIVGTIDYDPAYEPKQGRRKR